MLQCPMSMLQSWHTILFLLLSSTCLALLEYGFSALRSSYSNEPTDLFGSRCCRLIVHVKHVEEVQLAASLGL